MVTASDRLTLLYEVNRHMATHTGVDELLQFATGRVRELFAADGCAVLLLDRERAAFEFPVASQRAGRREVADQLRTIRFPADRGIAGAVVERSAGEIVLDAQNDDRFYAGVDAETGVVTRSVLCAPLRTPAGNIGVVEVINPAGVPGEEDLSFLEALADDFASAYERAGLYEQLRGEALGLRQVCTLSGIAVLVVGMLLLLGVIVPVVALAVPVADALLRPRTLVALIAVAVGAFLVATGRAAPPRRS